MNLKKSLNKAKIASKKIALLEDKRINAVLKKLADLLIKNSGKIIAANKRDLKKIDPKNSIYDRILLNKKRIEEIAESLKIIAGYGSPVGEIIESKKLKNGLKLAKAKVPLGVVGLIFEARPNVVVDVFAICFKAKNVCVMKGGSDCEGSNKILVELIEEALGDELKDAVLLLPNDRSVVTKFMQADKYVNVLIPRGSANLIKFVRENATIPVIETGAGVVHTYLDVTGNTVVAGDIVFNEKTRRPSVCNALDTLLIHKSRLDDLKLICKPLKSKKVKIFADKLSYERLNNEYPKELLAHAKAENYGKEYLSLQMSVKAVNNIQEAIDHINTYGSQHSEAIITEDKKNAEKFLKEVDAACVYVNASTTFTDGGEFGLGAEIGISTQKLHARGPMGIDALTSYKWLIYGTGQIRK